MYLQQNKTLVDDYMNDIHLQNESHNPLTQSVSSIDWSRNRDNILACSLWDGTVKIYQIESSSNQSSSMNNGFTSFLSKTSPKEKIVEKASIKTQQPLTYCCWNDDSSLLFYGTAAGQVGAVDMGTGNSQSFAQHKAPINFLKYLPENRNTLLSTAYENNAHFWDLRTPNPVQTICFSKKIFKTACSGGILAVGMLNEKIGLVSLKSTHTKSEIDSVELGSGSPIQSMALRKDGRVLSIGSVDGRVNVSYVQSRNKGEYQTRNHLTFKAHKVDHNDGSMMLYPVNTVDFNEKHDNIFTTCGSDGTMTIWNYLLKNKVKSMSFNGVPICCSKMSPTGNYLAYALGNDWHIGPEGEKPEWRPRIAVHKVEINEK